MTKTNKKPKYYCGLCEQTHTFRKDYVTCPSCGRDFCHEAIQEAIKVEVNCCPYCKDSPFEKFINYKEISQFAIGREVLLDPEDTKKPKTGDEVDIIGRPIKKVKSTYSPATFRKKGSTTLPTIIGKDKKDYTKIFTTIKGQHLILPVPTVFVDEIKENNDVISKEIARNIKRYEQLPPETKKLIHWFKKFNKTTEEAMNEYYEKLEYFKQKHPEESSDKQHRHARKAIHGIYYNKKPTRIGLAHPYGLSIEAKLGEHASELIYWNEFPEKTQTLIEKIVKQFDVHYKEVIINYQECFNKEFLVNKDIDRKMRFQYATKLLWMEYRVRIFGEKEDPRYELEKIKTQALSIGEQLAETPQRYGLEKELKVPFRSMDNVKEEDIPNSYYDKQRIPRTDSYYVGMNGDGTPAFLKREFGNHNINVDIVRYLRNEIRSWYQESEKDNFENLLPLDWHNINNMTHQLLQKYTEVLQKIPRKYLIRTFVEGIHHESCDPMEVLETLFNAVKEHQSNFYKKFRMELPIEKIMGAEWTTIISYVDRDYQSKRAKSEGKVLVWQPPDGTSILSRILDDPEDNIDDTKTHHHLGLLILGFLVSFVLYFLYFKSVNLVMLIFGTLTFYFTFVSIRTFLAMIFDRSTPKIDHPMEDSEDE